MKTECSMVAILVAFVAGGAPAQQAPPDYGHNFVTIGDVDNPAYELTSIDSDPWYDGRGSVAYEYRIARNEIRTSQWLEFSNAALRYNTSPIDMGGAAHWGANLLRDPNGDLVFVQESPEAGDWHVAGITWWAAAAYCNWLHNDKALTPEAFTSGAYDLSTFGFDPDRGIYTDQSTRSPGAKYWIPSLDEWMKAAHWDPDKDGPGEGGWWEYSNSSDTAPVTGAPGVGETNAYLIEDQGFSAWDMAVGSYPDTQSPWGLLDTSGGAAEWTEEWLWNELTDRVVDGSSIGDGTSIQFVNPDFIGYGNAANIPMSAGRNGLRIASAVPSPTSASLVGITLIAGGARRRR